MPPRAAGDWFKTLSDNLNMTIFMLGVPRLERLFESNEQLRLRASARLEFRPYDFRSPYEQNAFAACVRAYSDLFHTAGWPIDLSIEQLVIQCYLFSGGLVGVVSRFMQELASQLRYQSPRSVNVNDCRSALLAIESSENVDFPAFQRSNISALELNLVHCDVLEANGMQVRRVITANEGR